MAFVGVVNLTATMMGRCSAGRGRESCPGVHEVEWSGEAYDGTLGVL